MESIRTGSDVPDISLGKPELSAEAVAALHAALEHVYADDEPASVPSLGEALRHISGEAKLKNWPPERLLVVFKTTLEMVPSVRRLTRGPDRDEFVARLVSRCIHEYYRDASR